MYRSKFFLFLLTVLIFSSCIEEVNAQNTQKIIPPITEKFPCMLLYGPPGSGKGTQGKYLHHIKSGHHLSTGDIFRGLSPKSPAGKLFQQYASKGLLLPDEVAIEIWHYYVSGLIATNKYFPDRQLLLLDGMPRTVEQAKILDQYLDVKKIIVLDVDNKEILVQRLLKRATEEGRADDAKREVIEKRMEVYEKQTSEVLEHYPKHLIMKIDADQRPLQVLRDILIKIER